MSETEAKTKINRLRKLLGTVIKNTKASMSGKNPSLERETNHTRHLLKELLGRDPTEAEITETLTV